MPSFWPSLRSPGDSFWLEGRLDWHGSHGIVGGYSDPTRIVSPSLSFSYLDYTEMSLWSNHVKSQGLFIIGGEGGTFSLQLYTSSSDTLEVITSSIWNKTLEHQVVEKSNSITKKIFFIIVSHCLLDKIFSNLDILNIYHTNQIISVFLGLLTLKLFALASIIMYYKHHKHWIIYI